MSITKTQKIAVAIIVSSLLLGTGGMIWNIYGAFWGLAAAENAGIGAVGDSIRNALIFTAGGLIGATIGALILIFGRSRS